jgi:hypothetical protein
LSRSFYRCTTVARPESSSALRHPICSSQDRGAGPLAGSMPLRPVPIRCAGAHITHHAVRGRKRTVEHKLEKPLNMRMPSILWLT